MRHHEYSDEPAAIVVPGTPTSAQQVISGSQTIGTMKNNDVSDSYNDNYNSNNDKTTVNGGITMTGFGMPSNIPMPAGSHGKIYTV